MWHPGRADATKEHQTASALAMLSSLATNQYVDQKLGHLVCLSRGSSPACMRIGLASCDPALV